MYFGSDNTGPVAPEVMDALARANEGYASSYGADQIMDRVRDKLRAVFEAPDAAVYLVATGTAANALSIATLAEPWQAIYAHHTAHVVVDECAGPEWFAGGAKMVPVAGDNGKIDPEALADIVGATGQGDVHAVQRGPLSLTQTNEMGTVYTLEELRALTAIAAANDMPVHMDGARFANALVSLGCTPAEMTWKSGVDVLSFGGTKNGLMGVEAVILFDPARAWEFELRRKKAGHLFSKHRFLSAQMEAYLTDDLWLRLARAANGSCGRLAQALSGLGHCDLVCPVDANMIFARLPRAIHRKALDAGAQYGIWPYNQTLEGPDGDMLSARFVCNWSTTQEDIDRLMALLG